MKSSIIVPTRNRVHSLKISLDSIFNQSFQEGFEVIVVDNGSTDDTKKICHEYKSIAPKNISFIYVYEPIPGLLSGRHKGVQMASSELLTFIDDDIRADHNWLENIIKAFNETGADMIGGPSYPMYEAHPPTWINRLWTYDEQGHYCGYYSLLDLGLNGKYIDPNFVWGLNFTITKSALYACGGFHPDCIPANLQMYQGDGETGLTKKFKERGLKAWYEPKAKVEHLVSKDRMSLEYIYKREYYQGVCNSYTMIRDHGLIDKLFLKLFLKNFYFKFFSSSDQLKQVIRTGYVDGFLFHQRQVRKNKKLMNWILKKDYWDYRLPIIE